jgi:hypothetical protein
MKYLFQECIFHYERKDLLSNFKIKMIYIKKMNKNYKIINFASY